MTSREPATGRWSAALVARWVRSYTMGLPADVRCERRDEIASDLWEHAHDERDRRAVGPEILARGLLGIPADLSWRLERSRLPHLPAWFVAAILGLLARIDAAARWLARRGLPGFTTATGALTGPIGVLVIVTAPANNSGTPTANLVSWGVLIVLGSLAIGFGGRLIAVRTRLGSVLVMLGSALLGVLLWPTVIAPIAALALSWRAAIRIRDDRRQRRLDPYLD